MRNFVLSFRYFFSNVNGGNESNLGNLFQQSDTIPPKWTFFEGLAVLVIAFVIAVFLFLLPVEASAQAPCLSTIPHILQAPPSSPGFFRPLCHQGRDRIFTDFSNFYNQNTVKNYGVVLLGASVIANTKMDGNFQSWYQDSVRSNRTDDFSKVAKFPGEGQYVIPVMAASALTYRLCQASLELPECTLGEFADRTTRGYLVGAPTLLLLQPLLGAGRPSMGPSYWRPFQEANAVSGHAFIGAVPFITAAQMTDKPVVKGVFYTLSTFCAWSRVNDDCHYLSQVMLGWYLAYLSVRAVSQTEEGRLRLPKGLTFFPVAENDMNGVGLFYQY